MPLCLKDTEPVHVEPDAPWAKGMGDPAASVAVFRAWAPGHLRVLFLAEKRSMRDLPPSPDNDHPHIVIEPAQIIAEYSPN